MTTPQFSVTKSEGSLVVPSEATPSHTLPLSAIDRVFVNGPLVELFMVYQRGGRETAKLIRQALAQALVFYYPLAGRLVRTSDQLGEYQVACTGDGVWFVEATADCSLQEIGWLENPPLAIPKDKLLPLAPNPTGMFVMMQITEFTCCGFVVGLTFSHVMADGMGFSQILKAISEIARGCGQPTIEPVWHREHYPSPSEQTPQRPPRIAITNWRLEVAVVDIPQDYIDRMKLQFTQQTGRRCSTFDVTMAKLWQCRTRAIGTSSLDVVRLSFAANTRHLLSHCEKGYYGNCAYLLMAEAPSGKIANGSTVEVVDLIRDAKRQLPDEFSKWTKGELDESPFGLNSSSGGYHSVGVTDWTALGFTEVDYGWGPPAYFAPTLPPIGLELPPVCGVIKPPAPKLGSRLVTICVKEEHLEAFRREMMDFES